MKKSLKFVVIALFALVCLTLVACGSKPIDVESVTIECANTALTGDTLTATVEVKPSDATNKEVTWETSDATIATVTNGEIKCLKAGTVTIKASAGGKETSVTITIKDPITAKVSGETEAIVGDKIQLSLETNSRYAATWTSSDETIATVDGYGKVTTLKEGTVKITATVENVSDSVTINVAKKVYTIEIEGNDTVQTGKKLQLSSKVNYDDQIVKWTSSDETVATVDNKGCVTAVHKGTVVISATIDEVTDTKTITVTPTLSVEGEDYCQVGKTTTVVATTDSEQKVTWTSSDTTIATVDANGVVTFLKEGEVCITASVENLTAEKYIEGIVPNVFIGEVGYDSIETALSYAKENDTITLIAKEYSENITINVKGLTLAGPNATINPNTGTRVAEAVYTGAITIEPGTCNVTICGIEFTGAAKIEVTSNADVIDNFKFKNNYVHDTTETEITWSPSRDYNIASFIHAGMLANKLSNFSVVNNKFNNVSAVNVYVAVSNAVNISNNTFTNFKYDAIRCDGGYNTGNWILDSNVFKNDEKGGYNGIYFRSTGASAGESQTISVSYNTFENIGKEGVMFSGAMSSNAYQEYGLSFNVMNNVVKNCSNGFFIRNNAEPANHQTYPWVCNIVGNKFYGAVEKYYLKNNTDSDTLSTNPNTASYYGNEYYDADGNSIPEDTSKVIGAKPLS